MKGITERVPDLAIRVPEEGLAGGGTRQLEPEGRRRGLRLARFLPRLPLALLAGSVLSVFSVWPGVAAPAPGSGQSPVDPELDRPGLISRGDSAAKPSAVTRPLGGGTGPFPESPPSMALQPGTGIWLFAGDVVPGDETALVGRLTNRGVKHLFLNLGGLTAAQYAPYAPLIQQAHANAITVHSLCYGRGDSDPLSAVDVIQNLLDQVVDFNLRHPNAAFDGVQIDIEGTNITGQVFYDIVRQLGVPTSLVFSAVVQDANVSPFYPQLLQNTDLDLLIPMLYMMDYLSYNASRPVFAMDAAAVRSRTTQILSQVNGLGQIMVGVSSYDRQILLPKDYTGNIWSSPVQIQNRLAFDPANPRSVPALVSAGKTPADVFYWQEGGLSIYRFEYDPARWLDVVETTPNGLRGCIDAINRGGAGTTNYVGACIWSYNQTFDPYSRREEALSADDRVYPSPSASLRPVSFQGASIRLRIGLTNTNPSEAILGAPRASGVHLRLEGAAFVSADPGTFHAEAAFDSSGNLLTNTAGAQILELYSSFFKDVAAPQAQSGDIVVNATGPFTVRYRSWMTDKDSLCIDTPVPAPYVARSPDDIHYADPARLLSCSTYSAVITPAPSVWFRSASRLANGQVELVLEGETGWTYVIQTSTDLLAWQSVHQRTAAADIFTWTDSELGNGPRRSYRALGFATASRAPHPADRDADFRISSEEINAYAAAFTGAASWPIAPSPIPGNFYTNAVVIYQAGGGYHSEPAQSPPACWVPGM